MNIKILNLFEALQPGVYGIFCKKTNKIYIGQSKNILDRLAKHSRNFENGVSECASLQKDWVQYGLAEFSANIICCGPEFLDEKTRLTKEAEIIASYQPDQVYNYHPGNVKSAEKNYRIICEINGVQYNSVGEAARLTDEKEERIRVKLHSNYPGYKIISKVTHGYEKIIANGRVYESIMDAVKAGEAVNRFQAMRRLKSKKHKNWNYCSPEKHILK